MRKYDLMMVLQHIRILTMHALLLLHNFLKKSDVIKHEKRLCSILNAVGSLLNGAKLSLTSIGRHMSGTAKVKHKIKSSYNLLTNGKLHAERIAMYKALSEQLLSGKSEIEVLVDWSPCIHNDNQILKASVVLRGKTMTLYEEVHPIEKLGNYVVHKLFLSQLKFIIPLGIRVTVITDAGFRTEWFSLIKKMGWDFTGRVRANVLYRRVDENQWFACTSEYQYATNKPTYRGEIFLSKENKLQCFMYLYKGLGNKPTSKGFNLLLMSLSSGSIESIKLPKNKPLLIKKDDEYFIYGNVEGKQWKITKLDTHIIEQMHLNFPQENVIEKLPYHKAHKKLYDYIKSRNAHTSVKKKTTSGMDKEYRKSADDPWLIVSSHGPAQEYKAYDDSCNNQ